MEGEINNTVNFIGQSDKFFNLNDQISNIHKSIDEISQFQLQCKSFINRLSAFWGKVPVWQKISLGIVVASAFFIPGILAHIAVLTTIASFFCINYLLASLALDDHFKAQQETQRTIASLFSPLANLLGAVLTSLNDLRIISEQQLGKLHDEIENLTIVNQESRDNIHQMNTQLQQSGKHLQEAQLQIQRLTTISQDLEEQIKKQNALNYTLQQLVNQYGQNIIKNQTAQENFKQRLETFLNDKDASFISIIDRFSNAEEQLEIIKEELAKTLNKYNELFERYEQKLIEHEQNNNAGFKGINSSFKVAKHEEIKDNLHKNSMFIRKNVLCHNDEDNDFSVLGFTAFS